MKNQSINSITQVKNPSMHRDGFEIHRPFSTNNLSDITIDFYNRLLLQAYKLGVVEIFSSKEYGDLVSSQELDDLVVSVHQVNKRSVDFAVQELRECPAIYSLVNKSFLSICSNILTAPIPLLKIHFDGILVNVPKNEQRLYKFHTEQHYYPYRKNFLNLWMPIIRDKTTENGAMKIAHKGHSRNYSMSEYSGYSSVEGIINSEENFFYQLQIPPSEHEDLDILDVDLKVGDGLFFHQNLPHASTVNLSKVCSYAVIARVYDYRADLTLSDRTGVKLYSGGEGGFPNIRPIPKDIK